MLAPELKRDIDKLWDKFWSGGIANPLTAIEQIAYLIFMKRLEEADDRAAAEAKKENRKHKSVFTSKKDLRRWSNFSKLSGAEMLDQVQKKVFPLIVKLGGERMRDAVFVIPSATMLESAVGIVDKLFIPSRNADTLGDIYEYLLSEIQTSGKNGQFRTPRHIIRAIIEMVDPHVAGTRIPRICDPACGTAGFLVNSYIHIMAAYTADDILKIEADGTPHYWTGEKLDKSIVKALQTDAFYGYDFDRTMVRIGWMNMVQHGLTKLEIDAAKTKPKDSEKESGGSKAETKEKPTEPEKKSGVNYADALSKSAEQLLISETFDYVLANPPFTGSIEQKAKSERFKLKTNKTELLFVELILDLLVTGGRAGVIVPEGVLFGSTTAHRELRQRLITENQLEAVVSLPAGVFQPYTGVKTSALIFTKGGHTDNVWFYEVRADGQSLDARRAERPEENDLWDLVKKYPTRDTSLDYYRPIFREEIRGDGETYKVQLLDHLELVKYKPQKDKRTPEPHAWAVTRTQIEENDWNLSAGRYKPFILPTVQYDSPATIANDLQSIESQIQTGLAKLREMIENKQ
jgi:type I restriction enzyme M protein